MVVVVSILYRLCAFKLAAHYEQALKKKRPLCRLHWWEQWPPTNVAWVRFSDSASYVGWVCCFSALHKEVFIRVLRLSPLRKNQELTWFALIANFSLLIQCPQLVLHGRTTRHLNKVPFLSFYTKRRLFINEDQKIMRLVGYLPCHIQRAPME